MPTVRYQIRNEYGLADPEVYRAVDKDDPEALLEGVAMAGLVGVLRQLGDLAEFASEVFHNLHEEVMTTSARGHGLMLRVLQLEAEFPSIEKVILSETDHSHCAYSAGIDWHANHRVEQNLFSQGDMPRFILDSYEECRGPPQLFMLDKFDVAGAGACLTRYSNPSFFKTASAFSEMMEEAQREKKTRKPKKKGSYWKSGETIESFFTPIMDHLQFTASEPPRGKFPRRLVKLKHRKLRVSDISNKKSYMEGFLKEESFEHIDSESSLRGFPDNKSIDGAPVAEEVIIGGVTDPLPVRKEFSPFSLNDVTAKVQNQKRKDGEFLETDSISSSVSQKIYPNSQNAKEAMLASLGNEVDIHAFDISSDEIDTYPPPLQLASQNNILGVSGFTTDDDPDSCRSDDIGSELENYVDALNTMESEIEISSDSRAKPDLSLFKRESQGTDPNVNGQVELQHQSSGSSIVGSFGTSVISEEVKDGMPSLSQSTILVDLPEQQRKVRTVFEETSSLEFNHGETGKLETMSEDMTLIPSACLTSNETCYRNQPNAAMVVPSSRDAFTSCTTDSDLKSQHSLEEAQSLATHSVELNSSSIKNTPDIDEHIESSFLSWQTNHFVIFPACEEHPDILNDISEEKNPIEYSEDRNSVNIIDKGYMPSTFSETEYGIFPERAPECSKDLSTLLDDGIGKPLEVSEPNKNDYISKSSKPTIPVGSTALESQDTSNDLEIDVQSEDLAVNFPPNFMEGEDEEGKQLNSGVLFSTEIHELSLVESNESGLHRSTQTSEHVNDALACISDERGSPHGSQNNAVISRLSGYTDKKMSNDLANTLEMAQSPQTQAESSLVDVSSVCVKDSLHDSVENDNEACSVENLSPKCSAFSFDIVSSILQSESFATEIGYISATHEKFEHPKLSSSSGNIDILGCDALNYAAIPYELEHFPDVDNPQESSNGVMLKPFSSSCREDPAANKLHCEVSDLIETNGEESVHDGLKIANGSTKLSVQQDLQMLAENKINSFNGNCIPVDSMNDQNLNMIESAKVTTFDFLVEEDPHSGNDMLHQPYPDIEEPDLPRDLTSLQSENKSYSFFIENEEIETFSSSVSESQSFALDLSNSSEATLVHVKEDKLCSRENEQDFGSKSDNVATKDDTDGGGLSLLQSSNVCNFDVQFQEHPISEDAVFNLHESVTAELNGSNSDSKFNIVAQDGSDGQNLCLLESSNLYRFDVQSQEDSFSEGASLNQHMTEIQETAIESDLTSSTFESKLLAPLCEDEDQQAVGIVLSSQSQALNLSNFTYAKLADYKFDDVNMEESLISSREDEQHLDSDASMQHFQVDSERSETPSEKSSVSQAVDEPSLPSYRVLENIEPSYIQLDKVYSDELAIIQYNSEHEELLPVPEPETLLNHGCKNELNMPLSKTHENEQTETDISVSFQGVSKHHGDSMASEALSSESTVADFMIPIPAIGTHAQDTINILPGETISSIPINEVIEETPPLPPLPPMQWRMGKPQLGSLIAGASEPVMKTRPFIFPSSTGSNMHINPLPTSEEKMNQYAGPFVLPFTFEESFQSASSCTDGQLTESLKSSEFPVTTLDQRQQLEIYSSGLSLKEDGKHSHGIIKKDGESTLTVAPSLRDVISEQPDLLASGNPQAGEERRPKLVKLLPGLELERLIESPVMDRDAIPPLSSFMFVPTSGDGLYQYGYREYGGYEGDSTHYHKLSTPLPVAVQSIRPYAYHMFLREGNSSSMYDILLQDMEGDQPNEKHHSILSRPRDPLIEAVAAHDKSTLRKVSELDRPLPEPKEDEKNYLLEQIKTKSLNLKPSTSKANVIKAPSTNLRVAAILEKANAIRQACVGSDEDDDDSWNDS